MDHEQAALIGRMAKDAREFADDIAKIIKGHRDAIMKLASTDDDLAKSSALTRIAAAYDSLASDAESLAKNREAYAAEPLPSRTAGPGAAHLKRES
jgi:hypothetical protein